VDDDSRAVVVVVHETIVGSFLRNGYARGREVSKDDMFRLKEEMACGWVSKGRNGSSS
jgi:hypothetical protein